MKNGGKGGKLDETRENRIKDLEKTKKRENVDIQRYLRLRKTLPVSKNPYFNIKKHKKIGRKSSNLESGSIFHIGPQFWPVVLFYLVDGSPQTLVQVLHYHLVVGLEISCY